MSELSVQGILYELATFLNYMFSSNSGLHKMEGRFARVSLNVSNVIICIESCQRKGGGGFFVLLEIVILE